MKKVLSIHSSVMIGFVGNSVVAPVLSALGHQPMSIDTVTLPAHPGYGILAGGPTPTKQVQDFLDALKQLDQLTSIDYVITGYMGSPEQIDVIAAAIGEWSAEQMQGRYIFDPVLGDNGQLYIDPLLAHNMAAKLLPLANILTPNQFELDYLTSIIITDKTSAIAAATQLLDKHPNLDVVLATGIEDSDERGDLLVQRGTAPLWEPALADGKNVSGGGDLLTALFVGYIASSMQLHDAFSLASRKTQSLLAASTTSRELALYENLGRLSD